VSTDICKGIFLLGMYQIPIYQIRPEPNLVKFQFLFSHFNSQSQITTLHVAFIFKTCWWCACSRLYIWWQVTFTAHNSMLF